MFLLGRGGSRKSFVWVRLGFLAVFLVAAFVLHASSSDLAALRVIRIVLVVLVLGGVATLRSGRFARRAGRTDGVGSGSDGPGRGGPRSGGTPMPPVVPAPPGSGATPPAVRPAWVGGSRQDPGGEEPGAPS